MAATVYQNSYQLQMCQSQTDYSMQASANGQSTDGMLIPLNLMGEESWNDIDEAVGNGKITALSFPEADAIASPGVYTYLRIKSAYDGLTAYSKAIGPLLKIYKPVAKANNVKVTGMLAGSPYTKDQSSPYYGKQNSIVGNVWWLLKNTIQSPHGYFPGNTPVGKTRQSDCDLSNGIQILYKQEGVGTEWTVGLELDDEVYAANATSVVDSSHIGRNNWIIEGLVAGAKYQLGARRYLKKGTAAQEFQNYILEDSYGPLYLGPTIAVFDPDAEAEDDPMYIDQSTVTYDNYLDQIAFDMVFLESEVDNHGTATGTDDTELITTNGSMLLWSTKRDPKAVSTEAPNSFEFDDKEVEAQATKISGVTNTKKLFPDQQPNNSGTDFNHTTQREVWKVPTVLAELAQGSPNYISARRYRKVDDSISAKSKIFAPTICLFVSAKDSVVKFENLTPTPDGMGIEMDIVWDKNDRNSNGTEISWSEHSYAWKSSALPNTYDLADEWDWNTDIGVSKKSEIDYNSEESGRKHFVIGSLTPGTTYYVRVRRYLDGDIKTYGEYYPIDADMVSTGRCAPEVVPSTVRLIGPDEGDYVSQGDDLQLGWVTDSDSEQQSWRLFEMSHPEVTVAGDKDDTSAYIIEPDNPVFFESTLVNEGTVANPIYRFDPVLDSQGNATFKSSLEFAVCVSMGGTEVYSCELDSNGTPIVGTGLKVNIAAPPVVAISALTELTAQPITFRVTTDNARTNLAVRLVSNGIDLDTPAGLQSYPDGDVIWSGYFQPKTEANSDPDADYIQWIVNGNTYYVDLTLPSDLDLVDQGYYTLYVMATDILTEFSSDEKTHEFHVAWSHQAAMPYDSTLLYAIPESKTVKLTPYGPEEDKFDLYRHTPNGNYLIAEDVAYGTTVYDLYAPYVFDTWADDDNSGIDQYYIVVDKTSDGDIEERDFPYYLEAHGLTFDWGTGANYERLELPWNVDTSDSYNKQFSDRMHLDGKNQGYWNDGYTLESTFKTEVYRVNTDTMEGARLAELIRNLAKYNGPVMVRTPDGLAFTANVNVNTIEAKHDDPIVSVQFNVKEIDDGGQFRAYIPPTTT